MARRGQRGRELEDSASRRKLMEGDGTSRRTLFGRSESALRSRLDDVHVRDRALLRRDEGNGRVLLGEVPLQS